jgi:mitogen-activated protein kinase 15
MAKDALSTESVDRHIMRRYEILHKIGKGAYGIVWKVLDKQTLHILALKKAYDAFQNTVDSQRTYREISLLRQLRPHPNVIDLVAVHRASNERDIYIVFELMETDLSRVIRANILFDIHHRFIFWQLLCALKYIHSAGVVHRDMKPANVLINADATIKICDFGLARMSGSAPGDMTEYVATRWYRAPELLFGSSRYDSAVDIWAAGCILAELVSGRPLFPGSSAVDQLERIIAYTGMPSRADMDGLESDTAESMLSQIPTAASRATLEERMGAAPPDAIDLVRRLVAFNPANRMTAEEALEHPFVAQFHAPSKEVVAARMVTMALSDAEPHSIRDYRNQIYREAVVSPDAEKRRARNTRLMLATR